MCILILGLLWIQACFHEDADIDSQSRHACYILSHGQDSRSSKLLSMSLFSTRSSDNDYAIVKPDTEASSTSLENSDQRARSYNGNSLCSRGNGLQS